MSKIITVGLAAVLVLGLGWGACRAEEDQGIKKEVVTKTIQGEVSGISPNFIAIVYGQDKKTSYELALNIDKDVKVERRESLKEIGVGDTVSVSYEETTETKEGEKPRIVSRIVKLVRFLKAAEKQPETSALVSEEPAPEPENTEETEETQEAE